MARELESMYCCAPLWISVDRNELIYEPVLKCFGFRTDVENSESYQVMRYCPFCGARLPVLTLKFLDVVEEELGEDMLPGGWFPEDRKHLPQEFQTDEWWRKRGL